MNIVIIFFGKILSKFFTVFNLGNGSTWPGHIALKLNKQFISDLLKSSPIQTIVVAGTNGKTSTSSLIKHILTQDGKKVIHNHSGANLLNGIASSLLLNASHSGKLPYDFAIFEVDENVLPLLIKEVIPNYLVLLNLFRDQLDRYGEVHSIADKWEAAVKQLPANTTLILNADDPEIAYLGNTLTAHTQYFGVVDTLLNKTTRDHAVDSIYCPKCHFPLAYKANYYSHLGDWFCPDCKLTRPSLDLSSASYYPLPGTYNQYNTHAAVLLARTLEVKAQTITIALQNFKPAFGRQEIIELKGKRIQIFLSKNPTSFNQSLETIHNLGARNLLIVLNDRVADGHDVSWIWDTNLEQYLPQFTHITLSGDRCYDLSLRLKYAQKSQMANSKWQIDENLSKAISNSLAKTKENETLYVLPTYTAMLEVRKIITGKKIL